MLRLKAPKVLNSGYTEDGLYYFDMEYIQGITLAEYIKTMEIGKIKGLVEALVASIVPKIQTDLTSEEQCKVIDVFNNKIANLRKLLENKKNDVINGSLDRLAQHDWSKLTPSPCHGDMTLENIIVKMIGCILLIFLDSFYDSWFLDVGTLLQDVQVMWSYRFQKDISMNTVLRLIVFRDLLLLEIKKVNPGYVLEIYYSLLQKLIRIYPYTEDELTYQFLNEKTSLVLRSINRLEKQWGKMYENFNCSLSRKKKLSMEFHNI